MAQEDTKAHSSRQHGGGVAFGVTSLVTGIVSVVSGLIFWVSLPVAVVAIVFGALGMKKPDSRPLAIAGLVTGAVGAFIALAVIVLAIIAVNAGAPSVQDYNSPPMMHYNSNY
jgi:hypothetical protein